ncbi:MAG: glycosyl transferase, partial [Candidatus Rokubacteria bacterium]|nr:glycosyl transferase [Candidatus Rokubacteria bacterium]
MKLTAARLDVLCAAALSLLAVLSRLPYRARMLYNWDAVQFALALREYDVVKHQPHPPGYILYVGLGRLVN